MTEIELFYGIMCPYCRTAKKMVKKIMKENPDQFTLTETLISSPIGMIKRYKLGIHAVPTIAINGKIVFRALPEEEELRKELNLKKGE